MLLRNALRGFMSYCDRFYVMADDMLNLFQNGTNYLTSYSVIHR